MGIRLAELDARFVMTLDDKMQRRVDALAEADGVAFMCPKCYVANGGPIGTHWIICWFRGRVADTQLPGPGRWTPSGTGLSDLTFVPGDPPVAVSVLLTSGCQWHGFIRNGEAVD